jgi:hypothetical protein
MSDTSELASAVEKLMNAQRGKPRMAEAIDLLDRALQAVRQSAQSPGARAAAMAFNAAGQDPAAPSEAPAEVSAGQTTATKRKRR